MNSILKKIMCILVCVVVVCFVTFCVAKLCNQEYINQTNNTGLFGEATTVVVSEVNPDMQTKDSINTVS